MSNKHLVVSFFIAAMTIWVLSGSWSTSVVEANEPAQRLSPAVEETILVRATRSVAGNQTLLLNVRGQTNANRTVQVKSEISGKIIDLPGEKGRFVEKGDLLCRVAEDARLNEYTQAKAELESAKLEYNGFLDLNQRGLQSEILLAKAKARLERSKTNTQNARLALARTNIVAPFNGIVSSQPSEVGDFLSPGSICVSLMEIDPILVTGQVAEKNIGQMSLSDNVTVRLINGNSYVGKVSYIGHSPDSDTRTFPIEVTIDNPGTSIRAGLTADMQVPVGSEQVHLISPASLVLDDTGVIGVRIVDLNSKVEFVPVEVVNEKPEGIWIKGLPNTVNLITVGHEEVSDGQLVNIDFTPITELATLR